MLAYVPGYQLDSATDRRLRDSITEQSSLFQEDCYRVIIPHGTQPATYDYPITGNAVRSRRVDIDDLAEIDEVSIVAEDGTTVLATVDESAYVALYEGLERNATSEWEPIIALELPVNADGAPSLTAGQIVRIEGTWGFPSVPPFVKQAVAARVLLRYISDVAGNGQTDLAEQLATINIAGLLRTSEDAVERLMRPA